MTKSELAQLSQRIEGNISAIHLLMNEPTIIGSHNVNHKTQKCGVCRQEPTNPVGTDQAQTSSCETYQCSMEGNSNATPH